MDTRHVRLQNTLVAWTEISVIPNIIQQEVAVETLVVLPDAGAVLRADGARVEAPARSICILPAGPTVIEPKARGRVIRFFSPVPAALASLVINGEDYATPRAQTRPLERTFVRVDGPQIRVYEMDRFAPERPGRPPTIQSETMNVMWLERGSPHDRSQLAPHAHDDFEEGAIVVDGDYIQHLRTPWAADARQWRADEHRTCGPGTITIVPPTVVHTTEAIGDGRHLMLNVFAPVRGDQIKSGLVLNANEYTLDIPIETGKT
jgi:mannose-6-phosphate isomerase-like protein (cupin superfamily)